MGHTVDDTLNIRTYIILHETDLVSHAVFIKCENYFSSVILCGNSDYDFTYKQPTGPENVELAETQIQWIEDQIKNSKYVNVILFIPHQFSLEGIFNENE